MSYHSICTAVLLLLAAAACADGRTWRARVGNQQVEAEFVELRGSDVILKRADGKQIQVPLEKLSLEDVRYVEARTKASKDGDLPYRYGFKPGVTYNYAYRLDARLKEDSDDDAFWLYGGVGYTALPKEEANKADDAPWLDVDYHGSLYMKGSGKFKMGSEGAISHLNKTEHESLVINTRGEYISGKYDVSVPFMFTPLSLLPLDPLADYETSWVHQDSIRVATKRIDAPDRTSFFPYFRRPIVIRTPRGPNRDPFSSRSTPKTTVESERAATERCEYRWGEVTDKHRMLHRRYELKSVDGEFQANYDSVITFDREQHIPLRMEGDGTIQTSSDDTTAKTSVRFAYHLTNADAWRASESTRLIPNLFEVLDEARSLKLLEKLQNGTGNQRRDLMYYIKTLQPADYQAEIAAEIAKALGSEDFWQRYAAAQSIRRWATEKEAPAIIEAVKRGGRGEYYNWLLVAAGKFPSPEAAEAVAAALPAHLNAATAALIEMGPIAEDAVIKLAESSDGRVRWHAATILGVIGTEKSLPVLSELTSDGFISAKQSAEKAHKYLQARQAEPPAEVPPAATAPKDLVEPSDEQEAAKAAIKKLGGKIKTDSDNNVVEVSFLWKPVADADLEHVKAFTKLETLNLNCESFARNQITDAGLVHVVGLKNFRRLYLGDTAVSDIGLRNVRELKNLEALNLSGTKITDAGLEHLTELTQLKDLLVDHTEVTGAGLKHLKGLVKLESLYLQTTKIDDAGLEHLKGLTELERLALDHTKTSDAGLQYLKGMTKLKSLTLQNTRVTDSGLRNLAGLSALEELQLRWTRVSDAGLEHLSGLTKLKLLVLDFTDVTDAGVKKLQQALPDCITSP